MRRALPIIVLVIGGFVLWFNVSSIAECYGSGPPYYSRTTNMDKWVDPLPYLIGVDLVYLAACGTLFKTLTRAKTLEHK